MQGRDRLLQVQMAAASDADAHGEILQVVAEVLDELQVQIHRPAEGGELRLVAALEEGVIRRADDLVDGTEVVGAPAETFADGKPARKAAPRRYLYSTAIRAWVCSASMVCREM